LNEFHPILKKDFEKLVSEDYIQWDNLGNATFFITGATGLIGSLITKTLLYYRRKKGTNTKIYILARDREKAMEMYGDKPVQIIWGDVRQPFDIEGKLDYIIHAASVTTSRYMITNPVETLMTSIIGTDNVLNLAREKAVKSVVYLSSMEVYGVTTEEMNPITEEKLGFLDIHNVRSSYSEGKRACELLCTSYASEYGVPVKIARLAQTFGAGVRENESKVYASFAKSAIKKENIILHTRGESQGNYCYTADAVGALLCLLTKGEPGEAYNVVNESSSMKIKEIASLIAEKHGCKVVFEIPVGNVYGYAPESKMRLSGKKIESLGWNPSVGIEEMYDRMTAIWDTSKIL